MCVRVWRLNIRLLCDHVALWHNVMFGGSLFFYRLYAIIVLSCYAVEWNMYMYQLFSTE